MLKAATLALVAMVATSAAGEAKTTTPGHAARFAARASGSVDPQVSSNWSGYAAVAPTDATTAAFSDVTATWVQPKVKCSAGRGDSAAFWVGLGGDLADSQSLEQLGTEADCNASGAAPTYGAWWEIVPAASVTIPLKIRAGDHVTAAVLVQGQTVTMSLKDTTRRTRFSKTITVPQQLDVSSAEWIAEAPSTCSSSGRCRALPLTQFGSVTFTNAAATANAHPGTISDPAWAAAPIELIADGGGGRLFGRGDILGPGVGAVPGDLSADGRSFSVAWQQNVVPPGP